MSYDSQSGPQLDSCNKRLSSAANFVLDGVVSGHTVSLRISGGLYCRTVNGAGKQWQDGRFRQFTGDRSCLEYLALFRNLEITLKTIQLTTNFELPRVR